ncbi:sodium:solute symporter family protein [Novosphingobium humi]|uniref:Sodium:solute symporter family protein n=1 Tax=Novosphingobium humi TaxID=2282397 RepID=A0ABY7U1Q3_9SPHN|nr:sodium:solute symporter family protein [Novosphingobium humi]WCT79445.1 sodium:solute symporter family protein [Novosphingobium humi]
MIRMMILLIVLGTTIGAMAYGRAKTRSKSLEDWALGGRKMGTLVFWFLNAGEIYTTFAVLGISGFAWAYGAPAYLAFTSVSLSAVVGYWLTPRIHAYGRRHGLITQADFFAHRYQSRWLGMVVACAGLIALTVYIQIQVTALTFIVRLVAGPVIGGTWAAVIAVAVMLAFVFLAGLRSAAFAAGVKDVLMLVVVVVLAFGVAGMVGASSMLDVFARVQALYPAAVRFPGLQPHAGLSLVWLSTSAINVAIGTYIFPHMFQLCFSAGSSDTIRRNTVLQPIYSLSYFFIILLGFAALLAGTRPEGGDLNALLLTFVVQHCPVWLIGLFAGTASLLALVPGSVLMLTCGSIFARNIVRPVWRDMDDRAELLVSRWSMVGFAGAALWLALGASASLVEVGLSAYAAIGMLVPGVYLAFVTRRVSARAVMAGLIAGYAVLWVPMIGKALAGIFVEWEIGLVAVLCNLMVTLAAMVLLPPPVHTPAHGAK